MRISKVLLPHVPLVQSVATSLMRPPHLHSTAASTSVSSVSKARNPHTEEQAAAFVLRAKRKTKMTMLLRSVRTVLWENIFWMTLHRRLSMLTQPRNAFPACEEQNLLVEVLRAPFVNLESINLKISWQAQHVCSAQKGVTFSTRPPRLLSTTTRTNAFFATRVCNRHTKRQAAAFAQPVKRKTKTTMLLRSVRSAQQENIFWMRLHRLLSIRTQPHNAFPACEEKN